MKYDVLWLHHTPARVLRTIIPDAEWRAALKFTVIRNPWDRLVSFYHYRQRKPPVYPRIRWTAATVRLVAGWPSLWRKCLREVFRRRFTPKQITSVRPDEPFSSWLGRQMATDGFAKSFSCANYICDRNRVLLVDAVLRQDTLEEEFLGLCRRLGLKVILSQVNASGHQDYRSYYSHWDQEVVADRFALDVTLFDFRF